MVRYGLSPEKPKLVWVWAGPDPSKVQNTTVISDNKEKPTEEPSITKPETNEKPTVTKTETKESLPSQKHRDLAAKLISNPTREMLKELNGSEFKKVLQSIKVASPEEQFDEENVRSNSSFASKYKQYLELRKLYNQKLAIVRRQDDFNERKDRERDVHREIIRELEADLDIKRCRSALAKSTVTIHNKKATIEQIQEEFDLLLKKRDAPISEERKANLEKKAAKERLRRLRLSTKFRISQMERDLRDVEGELKHYQRKIPTSQEDSAIRREYQRASSTLGDEDVSVVYDARNDFSEEELEAMINLKLSVESLGIQKFIAYRVDPKFKELSLRRESHWRNLQKERLIDKDYADAEAKLNRQR
jgi:hypothetical protein